MKMVDQINNPIVKNNIKNGVPHNIEVLHTNEYIDYVQSLGFSNPSRMKFLFMENSLPSSQDSSMRVALLVGHAKIASLEGKFVEAKLQFDKALKYAQVRYLPKLSVKDRDNLIAYIHYEYALYCQLVHAGELANSHFYHASALTKSAKMKLLIEFQFALIDLYQSSESDTGAYIQFIEKFHQNEMKVMEGIALMRLGNFYRDRKDYTESHKCYKSAMTIAEKEGYNYLRWNIQNSMGLLVSKESSQEAAIQYYTKSLESMESPYFKALMLKNLANRYYAIKKPNKTREILTEALEHCQINGISSQISILAEGIGDLYLEIDSSTSHAYQYYQIAFNEVISLANTGIPITGKRLRVVEKYSNLIQENLPEDFMALKEPGLFEWSKGKTWIQIKDLFHYNLFVYHFLHTGIGNVTFSQLKIHPGTFYSLSKRMRDLRGITIPDLKGVDFELPPSLFLDPLQKYAQLHRDKTWDQVNKQFEKDIYAYLFEESGYNKVRLAKMLDRSYAMVIKRTKHLTDVEKDQTTQTKA